MPHAVPDDPRVRGQIPYRRHQGLDLRPDIAQSCDGACRRRLGHPQPLFGQTRSVPMQNL